MLELVILWIYQHKIPRHHRQVICLIIVCGGIAACRGGHIENFELPDGPVHSLIRQGPIRTNELLLVLDVVLTVVVVPFVVVMCAVGFIVL